MPAPSDVSIHIEAEDRSRQAFRQAEQSLESLERQTRELQQATRATATALGLSGNAAQEAGTGFTSLGRQIFQSQEEAKRLGGVFRSLDGRLREANGRFVKGREAVQDWTQAAGRATRGTGILTSSIGSLTGVLAGLGIAAVSAQLADFARGSVTAATRVEGFRNGLTALYGDAQIANQVLSNLEDLAQLPGITFEGAVQGALRLKTVSVEGDRALGVIREFGNAAALAGNNSEELGRAMIGLSQAIARGRIDQENLNQILENVPLIGNSIREAFGTIEASSIQDQLDAAGQSVQDFVDILTNQLAQGARASAESTANAFSNLGNAMFRLQTEVGGKFLPIVREATFGLTNFLDTIREGVADVSTLPPEIQAIVAGAESLRDGLLSAAAAIESSVGPEVRELASALATLLGGVLDLAGSIYNVLTPVWELWGQVNAIVIALITKLAQDVTSLIGVLTDFVDWVGSAWREEERFVSETERVTAAIENVSEATKKATTSTQEYQNSLLTILRELASVNSELEQKKAKLKELEAEGLTPADASLQQIVRRIGLLEERSKSLTGSLPDLSQALEDVNAELETKRNRLAEMTQSGAAATASAEHLSRSVTNLTALAALLTTQIAQTTTELTETAPAAETAAQAIENYSLTLARLKARAEDVSETLSNTIDFQKLGANYQAAIAASDAYYNRQIANAKESLAQAEANSDEYFKIETDLFKLQRDQAEARKKLTEQASKVGETEAERRVEIAEKEHERLRGAGEETARALEASEKRRTAAAEAEQKRLTQVHEDNLKQREEAERASNERIVKNSEEQLSALSNAFENALPDTVDRTYENIQQATVAHYETLKNQARQRITDEDALNAELVSLDRQRNAALEDNHRNYLQRIASDAKNLLGERTDAFKTASDDILHDWERTVSEFERQLREADTEDALRAIESDFEIAQQQMLASLESVLTGLGFTADETAKIMQSIFRTAEGESDGFADKVISAFQRLGKAADRETKRQNRQIERNYRELVGEIEHILSNITDFFIDITRGGDIEDAFRQLGERVAESFLDVFTRDVSENLAASLSSLASETDVGGAAASRGGGAGGAIQAAGGLTSILSLITSSVALAAIVPAVVFATTKYIGDKVGQTGVIDNPNRQGRPLEDNESRRRRGESQSASESRLRARAEAEAAIAERETFFGNYDPRAPFGRAIQESGVFTDDSGYFAEHALRLTDVDVFGNIDLPGLVEDLEGILQTRVEGLGEDMERAAAALENTTGADLQPALSEYFTATTDFYQTQIDFANFVRRTTGHLEFGDVEGLSRQLQESLNQARLQDTSTNLTLFGIQRNRREAQSLAERTGTDRDYTENIASAQYGQEAYDAEVAGAGTLSIEDTVDPELLSRLNLSNLQTAADQSIATFTETINAPRRTIESINEAFTTLEPDLRTLYDALFEGIAGEDGIINTAEEQIELNRLGTFDEFTQRYSDLRDTAIAATEQTQQRLATLSKQIATSDTLKSFSELAIAPGATIGSITEAWQTTVLPQINELYDQLFSEIAGADGFINTPEEQIAFLQLGSREDFVAQYESDILTPAVDKMDSIAEALAAVHQDRALSETFENFQNAAVAPGATISGITAHWNDQVVPVLRETYNALRADIIGEDGLISADEGLALAQAGLDVGFEDWAGEYENGILNPAITAFNQAAQIIASVTQNRELDAALENFNSAITAPGATVEGLTTHWTENVVPILQETYEFLRSKIIGEDGLISPAEAATLAQRGLDIPFEDWVGQYENDILDPGINKLNSIAISIATVHRDRRFEGLVDDFNAALQAPGQTVAEMTNWWLTNMTPVLRETYETLRADIIGEDGLISPEELQQLTEAGLDVDFVDWESNFRDDILTPGLQRLATTNTNIGIALQATEQSEVIERFNAAATAPGATIAGITGFWNTNVSPVLRQTFEGLRNQIIGTDGIISPDELLQLIQAGLNIPFEDWESTFRNDLLAPATQQLSDAVEYLESTELQTNVDTLVESFKSAIEAPGATIAALTQEWNETVVPALRSLYQDLYDDIAGPDGIINTAREEADLLQLGTVDEFVAGFSDDIFTPLTTSLQSGRRQTRSNLAGNQVNQARFDLRQSGSESEFEDNRQILLQAIAAFYDAEEQRIRALGLSAGQLQDQLQDLNLSRRTEIQGVLDLDNHFQTERLDMEKRTQAEIADLREDALDVERDRAQRLIDLEEETQERIVDIERDSLRRREDLQREFSRDAEDDLYETRAQTAELLRGEGVSERDINRFFSGLEGNARSGLDEDALAQLNEIQRASLNRRIDRRDDLDDSFADIGIRERRGVEDAGIRRERGERDINERADSQLLQLQQKTAALEAEVAQTQSQTVITASETAEIESQTAVTASETATTEAATTETQTQTAQMESLTAALSAETVSMFHETVLAHMDLVSTFADVAMEQFEVASLQQEAGHLLIEGAQAAGLHEAAAALQTVASNFHVLFTGNVASVQRLPSPVPQPNFSPSVQGGNPGSGGSPGPPPQPPQQLRARFQLMFPDGVVRDLQEQIVTLEAEDRV